MSPFLASAEDCINGIQLYFKEHKNKTHIKQPLNKINPGYFSLAAIVLKSQQTRWNTHISTYFR